METWINVLLHGFRLFIVMLQIPAAYYKEAIIALFSKKIIYSRINPNGSALEGRASSPRTYQSSDGPVFLMPKEL